MKSQLQELVDKHCFAIHEYAQSKDEDRLIIFDKELYGVFGVEIRAKYYYGKEMRKHDLLHSNNNFTSYDNYFHIKTPLGNTIVFYTGFRMQSKEIYLYKIKIGTKYL